MAKAEPGSVLVSGTVKDLVSGSEIDFEDRGVHNLKGIPGEWRLFAAQ
jgi:class 3 adenylate cyclase